MKCEVVSDYAQKVNCPKLSAVISETCWYCSVMILSASYHLTQQLAHVVLKTYSDNDLIWRYKMFWINELPYYYFKVPLDVCEHMNWDINMLKECISITNTSVYVLKRPYLECIHLVLICETICTNMTLWSRFECLSIFWGYLAFLVLHLKNVVSLYVPGTSIDVILCKVQFTFQTANFKLFLCWWYQLFVVDSKSLLYT